VPSFAMTLAVSLRLMRVLCGNFFAVFGMIDGEFSPERRKKSRSSVNPCAGSESAPYLRGEAFPPLSCNDLTPGPKEVSRMHSVDDSKSSLNSMVLPGSAKIFAGVQCSSDIVNADLSCSSRPQAQRARS